MELPYYLDKKLSRLNFPILKYKVYSTATVDRKGISNLIVCEDRITPLTVQAREVYPSITQLLGKINK